jgi:hypothetical protein
MLLYIYTNEVIYKLKMIFILIHVRAIYTIRGYLYSINDIYSLLM